MRPEVRELAELIARAAAREAFQRAEADGQKLVAACDQIESQSHDATVNLAEPKEDAAP
jgi:hypothetical protein